MDFLESQGKKVNFLTRRRVKRSKFWRDFNLLTDGSIEACEACKKYEDSAKFRAKFKKVKEQQMRKTGRSKVK